MIEPALLLAWSALALAVTLAPGPDTMLVVTHAARSGLRAGLAAVAGAVTGALWYAGIFGVGALALLAATPVLFTGLKIAGATYLIFLGAQLLWRAVMEKGSPETAKPAPKLGAPYRQALITNILNPKVALFYLAALPQFASGENAPLIGALLIGIHALFGATWLSFVAYAASRARQIVWDKTIVRWLEGAIGAFFIGVAGRLALAQR